MYTHSTVHSNTDSTFQIKFLELSTAAPSEFVQMFPQHPIFAFQEVRLQKKTQKEPHLVSIQFEVTVKSHPT